MKMTARQKAMYAARDFLGEETFIAWNLDYEQLRQFRNQVAAAKQKPSPEIIAQLAINKIWERFYQAVLYGGVAQ